MKKRMKTTYRKDGFKGNVVLVTGAGNGIGRACAIRFAQEGATTIICDIDKEGLKKTAKMVKRYNVVYESYIFDISKKQEVDEVVNKILNKYMRVDVLLYSAGVIVENSFLNISEEEWLKHINVNLNGAFYITQTVLKKMTENMFGKIIYIGSKSGLLGRPNRASYCASKFGLNGLTKALALEVAEYGITVNSINPGRTESEMTRRILERRAKLEGKTYDEVKIEYEKTVPLKRLAKPEDIANMAAFLASEEASYITGECISVSGGR
jgi:NAD(P)-dependent dehydrogenase (short-subunit alcohol dehydrogenase family)